MTDWWRHSAAELAGSGASAREILDSHLGRIEDLDRGLNAFSVVLAGRARDEADERDRQRQDEREKRRGDQARAESGHGAHRVARGDREPAPRRFRRGEGEGQPV